MHFFFPADNKNSDAQADLSSLGAHVRRYVFSGCGSFVMKLLNVLTNNNIIMWTSPYSLQMSIGPDNLVRGIIDCSKYVHCDFP